MALPPTSNHSQHALCDLQIKLWKATNQQAQSAVSYTKSTMAFLFLSWPSLPLPHPNLMMSVQGRREEVQYRAARRLSHMYATTCLPQPPHKQLADPIEEPKKTINIQWENRIRHKAYSYALHVIPKIRIVRNGFYTPKASIKESYYIRTYDK